MDETQFCIYGFGVFLFLITLILFRSNYRLLKVFKGSEVAEIGSLKKGYQKIKGTIKNIDTILISPLSDVECVYYKFYVQEVHRSGATDIISWETFLSDEKGNRFAVEDDSGRAIVEVNSSAMDIICDVESKSGVVNKPTERMILALDKYSQGHRAAIQRLRYFESFLEVGDEVFVLGEVVDFDGESPVFRTGKKPYIITDRDQNEYIASYNRKVMLYSFGLIAIITGMIMFIQYY